MKQKIIDYHRQHPGLKHKEMINFFRIQFEFEISLTKIKEGFKDVNIRIKSAKFEKLQEYLYMWHQSLNLKHCPISDDSLIEKAEFFGS